MKFEIIPYVGAGMIKFGMNEKQLQKALQLNLKNLKNRQ
ncbi:hypothetical protein F4694_006539 [Bacillus niacini]|uniref:Uncharacterized protein n=1 Tax=Neobacillus niacini TaxID=86668 RepID=A0A852TPQ3_9BACI|nr:hypothetical protein [Neobacillus niacini]